MAPLKAMTGGQVSPLIKQSWNDQYLEIKKKQSQGWLSLLLQKPFSCLNTIKMNEKKKKKFFFF